MSTTATHVGGSDECDALIVCAYTVELTQQLCLQAPRRLILAFLALPTNAVDFVNEDNARLGASSVSKQLLQRFLWRTIVVTPTWCQGLPHP